MKSYHWVAADGGGDDAGQALHPDAAITAWGLSAASKLASICSCGTAATHMRPTTEALEAASSRALSPKLSIAVEQTSEAGTAGKRSVASIAVSVSKWLQVRIHHMHCKRHGVCMFTCT